MPGGTESLYLVCLRVCYPVDFNSIVDRSIVLIEPDAVSELHLGGNEARWNGSGTRNPEDCILCIEDSVQVVEAMEVTPTGVGGGSISAEAGAVRVICRRHVAVTSTT